MKVKVINKSGFELPKYETENSAGMDLKANIGKDEEILLRPFERRLIPTGLFIEIPTGYEGQVRPRSGLAIKHGITVLNTPGTIDADYRGEIGVILINLSNKLFHITHGMKVAQIVFSEVKKTTFKEVEKLGDTTRGKGGFGHTGV